MAVPDRIGRYRIVRLIGTGAGSTVFEAHDEELDVPVAVKVLAENWLHREDVVSSFLREARLLRSLEDPRVVAVHDIGRLDSGQPYLVMDLLPASLSDRLVGAEADPAAALRVGHELVRALEVLHSRGLVHRDIKPANLFVLAEPDPGGPFPPGARIVLGDFGLVGVTGESGPAGGTPGYMSPEQARGDPLDERADIHAAAAVIHRVATGQLPPRGELPRDLRPAVEAGLAPDPAARPGSIGDLAALLDGAGSRRVRPRTWAAVGVVVVALVVLAGLSITRRLGSGGASTTGAGLGPASGTAADPLLFGPRGVDAAGGLIAVADTENHRIVVIDRDRVSVFGGFRSPSDVAIAPDGAILVADTGSNRVLRLAEGSISTVAGDGTSGFSGDGGPAESARLNHPLGIGFDDRGNLLVADSGNHRVRRISDGTIETIAGNGLEADSGDGAPALEASLLHPVDAVGWRGGVAIVDRDANRVRWTAPEGTISTIAGTGSPLSEGDGGPAVTASLLRPTAIVAAGDGSLLVTDGAGSVRRLTPDGTISTAVGGLDSPRGAGEDGGSIFVTGAGGLTRSGPDEPTVVLLDVEPFGPIGDGGDATAASLLDPLAVTRLDDGRLVIADSGHSALRIVDTDGTMSSSPVWVEVADLAAAADGTVIAPVPSEHRVVRIDIDSGTVSTVAGGGSAGDTGDGGLAADARLRRPEGVAVDRDGTVYIADAEAHRIRAVSPDGVVRTVVGTGEPGSTAADDPTRIGLNGPTAVVVGTDGELYVADEGNRRILVVRDGSVEVLATDIDSPHRLAVSDRGVFVLSGSTVLRISPGGTTSVVELASSRGDLATGGSGILVLDACRGTLGETVDGEIRILAGRPIPSCP